MSSQQVPLPLSADQDDVIRKRVLTQLENWRESVAASPLANTEQGRAMYEALELAIQITQKTFVSGKISPLEESPQSQNV